MVLQDRVACDVQDIAQHGSCLGQRRHGSQAVQQDFAGLDSVCVHQNNTLCWDLWSLQSCLCGGSWLGWLWD